MNLPYMNCLANPIFSVPATDWVNGGVARAVVNHQSSGSERALSFLFRGPRSGAHHIQHLLSTKGHEGPRRTATATPFVHEGPRRTTKNHEELQLQHLLSTKGREGPRRATKNCNCYTFCPRRAAKGHEGPRRTATATPFVHEGPLRAAKNTFNPFLSAEGS